VEDYDWLLRHALLDIQLVAIDNNNDVNVFCKLIHPILPAHSFRTYHPQYLRQRKLWSPAMNLFARQFETLKP
jgi:hypothetical protein